MKARESAWFRCLLDPLSALRYFLHLSAMGLEPWDHAKPFEDSSFVMRDCARAVARTKAPILPGLKRKDHVLPCVTPANRL